MVYPPHSTIESPVRFGLCVTGIAKRKDGKYVVGHFAPGEIVTELKALCDTDINGRVVVYQTQIHPSQLEELYRNGKSFKLNQIKKMFIKRDRGNFGR